MQLLMTLIFIINSLDFTNSQKELNKQRMGKISNDNNIIDYLSFTTNSNNQNSNGDDDLTSQFFAPSDFLGKVDKNQSALAAEKNLSNKKHFYLSEFSFNLISNNEDDINKFLSTSKSNNSNFATSLFKLRNETDEFNEFLDSVLSKFKFTSKVFIYITFFIIFFTCIFGNILVILSVFTYKPLKSVQNIFIVSLAVADLFVACFVMPFHISYHFTDGKWLFGTLTCHFFLTLDILLCTASTLHLCCIALDRYWAIKDSIKYAQQRTMKRVLIMITMAWISSALISLPVIVWNTKTVGPVTATNYASSTMSVIEIAAANITPISPKKQPEGTLATYPAIYAGDDSISVGNVVCDINFDKLYRFYSSSGTFWVPLLIMTFVYVRIYLETKRRLRERAHTAMKLANSMAKSSGDAAAYSSNSNSRLKEKCVSCFCCCLPSAFKSAGKSRIVIKKMVVKEGDKTSSINNINNINNDTDGKNLSIVPMVEGNGLINIRDESLSLSRSNGNNSENNNDIKLNSTDENPPVDENQANIGNAEKFELENLLRQHDDGNLMIEPVSAEVSSTNNTIMKNTLSSGRKFLKLKVSMNLKNSSTKLIDNNKNKFKQQQQLAGSAIDLTVPETAHEPSGFIANPATWTRDNNTTGLALKQRQKISLTRERKAARTLGIIMGAFIACWLPFFVVYILQSFDYLLNSPGLFEFLTWLGYVNSALNPIIYTVFNLDFRKSFKRILFHCILFKRR